jgi:aldehyde:ferredoxin oxidoreductase
MKATRLCDGYGLDMAVMAPLILWLIDCYHEGLISEKDNGMPILRRRDGTALPTLFHGNIHLN